MMTRWFVRMSSVALMICTLVSMPRSAEAWFHGCNSYRYGAAPIWGSYGMGGGFNRYANCGYRGVTFTSGYSSFRSCYRPSFSAYYPRCLSYGPSYYSSFYSCPPVYTPVCYPPVYYSPVYCAPVVYRPVVAPTIVYPRPCATPVIWQTTSFPTCVAKPVVAAPRMVSHFSAKPKESWLASAVELIDLMVQQGGVEEGLQACEQLIRVREGLPGEIYWRAAALAAVSGRDTREIIAFIDDAEKSGDQFSPRQLPGGSLRDYLARAKVTKFEDSLNRLAKAAMASDNPMPEYRVLSAMFALDSQPERARLFLAAANDSGPNGSTVSLASLASLDR